MSDHTRSIGLYAVAAALASLFITPLLGLAYFATEHGREELETGSISAWAEPARDAAGSLLTFAGPDRVYSTYLQAFAVFFPAVLLTALLVRSRWASQSRRPGRWAWRVALGGYALLATGVTSIGLVLIAGNPSSPVVDPLFMGLLFPGILFSTTGSTALGIGLLRSGYRPRVTAWLLALAFPLWIVGDFVIGHNSIGLVPLMLAWGATGLEFWRLGDRTPASKLATTAAAERG
jgi:hypothetical protein